MDTENVVAADDPNPAIVEGEYVVEVSVTGFAVEGQVAVDGHRLTEDEAKEANEAKHAAVEALEVDLVEAFQREDGSGIFYFRWDPPAEAWVRDDVPVDRHFDADPPEGAAQTWHSAKLYTEHVVSAVVGAGFSIADVRIVTRAREDAPRDASQPSPPAKSEAASRRASRGEGKSGGAPAGG